VRQLLAEALAFADAAVDGVGKRDADQESESGLDGIVKAHSSPLNMRLIVSKDAPEQAAGKGVGDGSKALHFAHHEQHDEAPVRVDSDVARRRGGRYFAGWL